MKKNLLTALLILCVSFVYAQTTPNVIPIPQSYRAAADSFQLSPKTFIVFDHPTLEKNAYFLQKELLKTKGTALSFSKSKQSSQINLTILPSKNKTKGAYSLKMSKNSVEISASDSEGIFNGIITFLQLTRTSKNNSVKCWTIEDFPLYDWRGVMLDESRHFFGKEKVKMLLDWMAFYKLNKFHWHLTDQHGWRIEIKKYPLLTYIGGIGNYTNPNAAPTYYSQEEIKEIVAYAAERNISVIPEIDMPGHATAANKAYPQFSGGGSEKYPEFTFDPGNEGTYQYLTDILKEVNVLFPSEMIHLGGDEVSFGNQQWKHNQGISKLMEKHGLKTMEEVERHFMARMADSLFSINNQFLAWDEMAEGNFPKDKTIIFWWRHDKKDQLQLALNNKYPVVLCPRIPLYFDFVQDETHLTGRRWAGNFSSVERTYAFTADSVMATNQKQLVLGIQANLWTETVVSEQRLDFMLFPRISALAEAAWNEKKNYPDYLNRLKPHLELYRADGIYFFNPLDKKENAEARR